MKRLVATATVIALLALPGCRSPGIHYSRALFQHIPEDPELLVLVRPNDLARVAETAVSELALDEFFKDFFDWDPKYIAQFQNTAVQMIEALGIPWEEVEAVGFLLFFQQPVILVSGEFTKAQVENSVKQQGFKQLPNGFFEYIFNDYRLHAADDGLIMLAKESLLEDLTFVPEDKRLWNREDFSEYRLTSPLDNSLFVWSHPPEHFLSEFPNREALGDLSLALDLKRNINFKMTVRVNDPQKVVYLHDILFGIFTFAGGFFGDDEDYGPVFKGVKVTQDNNQVVTSLVIPAHRVESLKDRIARDIRNEDDSTLRRMQEFFNKFK